MAVTHLTENFELTISEERHRVNEKGWEHHARDFLVRGRSSDALYASTFSTGMAVTYESDEKLAKAVLGAVAADASYLDEAPRTLSGMVLYFREEWGNDPDVNEALRLGEEMLRLAEWFDKLLEEEQIELGEID